MVGEVSAERHDRRVGRVHLGIDRRIGQVARQRRAGGIDRRLHVLRGGIDVAVELELQRDLADPERARRGHQSASDGICPKLRSSGAVTSDAMVSGLAPGSWVVTWMVGKSTCGSEETGSHR